MLHLFSRNEVVGADDLFGYGADLVPPTERGQRCVGNLDSSNGELFVNPNQIALAASVKLANPRKLVAKALGPLKDGGIG